jgi:hypothetical protein
LARFTIRATSGSARLPEFFLCWRAYAAIPSSGFNHTSLRFAGL